MELEIFIAFFFFYLDCVMSQINPFLVIKL